MKKTSISLQAAIFLISILFVGCSNPVGDKQKKSRARQEITINIESEPNTIDPRKTRSLNDINLVRNLMEGLMRVNQNGVTSPAVAEKYQVSEDMKTYTFKLRESKWSNGDPLTAHDFVYAWKKVLSPDFLSDYAFMLYPIKNAKSVKHGLLPLALLGVEAKDDYTLKVELEYPVPFFLELLTLPVTFPINKLVDSADPNWSRSPETYVNNGPFQIIEWKHNDQVVVLKNPLYWDSKAVSLEKINMVMVDSETGIRMFENGELAWEGSPFSSIPLDSIQDLQSKNLIHKDPMLGTFWIRTNTSLFPLHNPKLRKALALAINRKEIVEHVSLGQLPATGIVPFFMGLQTTPYFEDGDQKEAMALLEASLAEEQIYIEKLPEFTISYVNTGRVHRIAQAIQDQWMKGLGIKIKLEPLEQKVYFSRLSKGDFQLACGSWIADFRDPINFLEVFKTKSVGTNNTFWESLDYEKAINDSYFAPTEIARIETLRHGEEILMEEMPVIPVFHYTMLHVKNDKLCDVVLTEGGQIDFKWAYVK